MSRIDGLNQKNLIAVKDLKDIRQQIFNQYPDLPPNTRARLFANHVNRRIDDSLYGVDMSSRRAIRQDLIRDYVLEGRGITYLNLLDAITDQPYTTSKHLQDWFKLSVGLSVSQYELEVLAVEAMRRKRKRKTIAEIAEEGPTAYDLEKEAMKAAKKLETPTVVEVQSVEVVETLEPVISEPPIEIEVPLKVSKRRIDDTQVVLPWDVVEKESECYLDLDGNIVSVEEEDEYDEDRLNLIHLLQEKMKLKTYRINKKRVASLLIIPMLACGFYFAEGLFEDRLLRHYTVSEASVILDIQGYKENTALYQVVQKVLNNDAGGMPEYLKYKKVDLNALRAYLRNRNSMLAQDPYFMIVVNTCKEHNVNPLLLFAITGQEQGFVPRDSKHLWQILNNPFNVYTSWKSYNTTLKDSTEIAVVTIIEMLKDRPKGNDPFKWLNDRYAEDPKWWRGTKIIFQQLTKACEFGVQ